MVIQRNWGGGGLFKVVHERGTLVNWNCAAYAESTIEFRKSPPRPWSDTAYV